MNITALPSAPLPTDNTATFNSKAFALVAALDNFVTEANATGAAAEADAISASADALSASDASIAAVGAANFKGAWSGLSGALAIPASVSHLSKVWILTESVANVTTEVPGTSAKWLSVSLSLESPGVIGGVTPNIGNFTSVNTQNTFGFKNRIINGNPLISQRGVSGTVSLGAGAYGHDRWKAGASGCIYTFATVNNVTTLTITAGSLIQVVEGLNLETGTYCLSWTGTAQGKIGAGSYAASGVTGSITGGSNTSVEFNTGTLALIQLEKGSIATAFDYRDFGREFLLCQRYYEKSYVLTVQPGTSTTLGSQQGINGQDGNQISGCRWQVAKRASPSVTIYSTTGTSATISTTGNANAANAGSWGAADLSEFGFRSIVGAGGLGAATAYAFHYVASSEL